MWIRAVIFCWSFPLFCHKYKLKKFLRMFGSQHYQFNPYYVMHWCLDFFEGRRSKRQLLWYFSNTWCGLPLSCKLDFHNLEKVLFAVHILSNFYKFIDPFKKMVLFVRNFLYFDWKLWYQVFRLSKNATRQDIQQKTWQMSRHWFRHYTTYDIFENYCISQSFRWFPTLFWKSPFLCPKRRTFGDFGLKIPLFGFFTFLAVLNNLKHFSAL